MQTAEKLNALVNNIKMLYDRVIGSSRAFRSWCPDGCDPIAIALTEAVSARRGRRSEVVWSETIRQVRNYFVDHFIIFSVTSKF
jgi:hypothetical protein